MKKYRVVTSHLSFMGIMLGFEFGIFNADGGIICDFSQAFWDKSRVKAAADTIKYLNSALKYNPDWFEEVRDEPKLYTEADMLEFGEYINKLHRARLAEHEMLAYSTTGIMGRFRDFVAMKGQSGCNSPLETNE